MADETALRKSDRAAASPAPPKPASVRSAGTRTPWPSPAVRVSGRGRCENRHRCSQRHSRPTGCRGRRGPGRVCCSSRWGARRAAERFRVKRVGGDGKTNQPTDQLTLRVSSPHGDYDGGWPGHSKGVPQREMAQLPIDNTSGPSRIPGRECGCLAPSRVEDKVWDPCVQGDPWGDTERASGHASRNARLDPQARRDAKKMLTVSLKEGDSGWQCVGAAVPPLRPEGWRGP